MGIPVIAESISGQHCALAQPGCRDEWWSDLAQTRVARVHLTKMLSPFIPTCSHRKPKVRVPMNETFAGGSRA